MMFFTTVSNHQKRGFTLVELLVTISVIGILAGIVFVNFTQARMHSRDKIRMAQLDQMRVALELYKEEYGRYPARGCTGLDPTSQNTAPVWSGPANDNSLTVVCDDYIVGHSATSTFVPKFIEALPRDPGPSTAAGEGIFYRTNGAGSFYTLLYVNSAEKLLVADKSSPYARYGAPGCATAHQPRTYAIYSSGGGCF